MFFKLKGPYSTCSVEINQFIELNSVLKSSLRQFVIGLLDLAYLNNESQ